MSQQKQYSGTSFPEEPSISKRDDKAYFSGITRLLTHFQNSETEWYTKNMQKHWTEEVEHEDEDEDEDDDEDDDDEDESSR